MPYILNSGDITLDPKINRSNRDKVKEVIKAIYEAHFLPENHTIIDSQTFILVNVRQRNEGASGDLVFEALYSERSSGAVIRKYIIKAYANLKNAVNEKTLFNLARNIAGDFFSSTILEYNADESIIVIKHADTETGSEVSSLHKFIENLLINPDKVICDNFCEQLIHAGRNATRFYEQAAKTIGISLISKQPLSSYADGLSYKFPPNIIVNLENTHAKYEDYFEEGGEKVLIFTSNTNQYPGPGELQQLNGNFKNWLYNSKSKSDWKIFTSHNFNDRIFGNYYEFLERTQDGEENDHLKIWIKFPPKLPEGIKPESTPLVIYADKAVIKSNITKLEDLKFSNEAIISYKELFHSNELIELEVSHFDLHTDNILISKNGGVKIIDFGKPEYCLAGTMAARLETSLWKKLDSLFEDQLNIGTEINNILNDISEGNQSYDVDKVKYVLTNVIRAIRKGFSGSFDITRNSYAVQCLNVQKNMIRDEEACYSGLNDFVSYVYKFKTRPVIKAIKPASITETIGEPSSGDGPTIMDLWGRAFDAFGDTPEPVLLDADENFLRQMQVASPRLFASSLTSLQSHLYNCEVNPFLVDNHVILSGPTSSGKSTLIELFMARVARKNTFRKCAVYISPTRSLTRAKYEELKERFRGTDIEKKILMSTGEERDDDWKIQHGKFSIVCMVYEKANMLLSLNTRLLDKIGCIVVDELHMLMDIERGPILELALTKMLEQRQSQFLEERTHKEDLIRVVCVTTEGGGLDGIRTFLETNGTPPLVFESNNRPINITHNILFPCINVEGNETCNVELIATFKGETERGLSRNKLIELYNKLEKYKNLEFDKYLNESKCFINFIKEKLNAFPYGYRALVFVPGKEETFVLANTLKNLFKKPLKEYKFPSLVSKLLSSEDPKANALINLSQHSIFVHHSDLEKDLRNEIEDVASSMNAQTESQVIFCTETLSYGVNLAITDVFIYGIEFWSQSRNRTPRMMPLSAHGYHNMAGRAGRLGKEGTQGNNVYIMDRYFMDPVRILNLYYGKSQNLLSKIYVNEDKIPYLNIIDEPFRQKLDPINNAKECQYFDSINVTDFTYPFARSVLDVLRFLNARKNIENLIPITAEEIIRFLGKTLFGSRIKDEANEVDVKIFSCSVKRILKACTDDDLGLARSHNHQKYMITDRGQSIIDTGTELATIQPAWKLIKSFHAAWNKNSLVDKTPQFPSEFYLLVMLAVPEISRRYLMNTPECRGECTLENEAIEKNRNYIKNLLISSCSSYLLLENSGFINDIISILESETDIDIPQENYTLGRADGIIRAFCSLLAWMNFEPQSRVVQIFEISINSQMKGLLSNFRNLMDILNWRMLFLNILLNSSSNPAVQYNYESARKLRSIAERIRLGCTEVSIPLFWPTRESRVKRVQARFLVENQITPPKLLKAKNIKLESNIIRPEQINRLVKDIGRHCVEQFEMLINEMQVDVNKQEAERRNNIYEIAVKTPFFFQSSISTFRRSTAINPIPPIFHDFLLESFSSLGPAMIISSKESSHSDLFILRNDSSTEKIELTRQLLRSSNDDSLELVAYDSVTWEIIGIHMAHDGMCYINNGQWIHIRDILTKNKKKGRLLFVTTPWLPENIDKESLAIIRERDESGLGTRFTTLPCFMLQLLLIIKNYTSGIQFFNLLQEQRVPATAIGVQEFYDFYKNNGGQKLVSSIEEKLIGYFEVV